MNALRQFVPGLALALCVGGAAYADTPATDAAQAPAATAGQGWRGGARQGGFRQVLAKLNLNADQQVQIKSILAQSKPQFRALMASNRANREALATTAPTEHPAYDSLLATSKANAASGIQLRSDVWAQIHAVLTPAQQAQIPGIVAAQKAARDARRAAWQSTHGQT
jgi:periplasmic protein CpxP/Spy